MCSAERSKETQEWNSWIVADTSCVESLTRSCADTAGQEGGNCDANSGRAPGESRGLQTVLCMLVEVEYKISAHLGEGEVWKSWSSFCREKTKNSLKVSGILWVRMIHLIWASFISGRQNPSRKGHEESKQSSDRTNVFALSNIFNLISSHQWEMLKKSIFPRISS